jgi:hypothetical protein
MESAQAIEKNVMIPMNELAQNTKFHFDLLRYKMQGQLEFLCGGAAPAAAAAASAVAAGRSSSGSAGDGALKGGLQGTIRKLIADHELLVERVNNIQARFENQQEIAAQQLTIALALKPKVNPVNSFRCCCRYYTLTQLFVCLSYFLTTVHSCGIHLPRTARVVVQDGAEAGRADRKSAAAHARRVVAHGGGQRR